MAEKRSRRGSMYNRKTINFKKWTAAQFKAKILVPTKAFGHQVWPMHFRKGVPIKYLLVGLCSAPKTAVAQPHRDWRQSYPLLQKSRKNSQPQSVDKIYFRDMKSYLLTSTAYKLPCIPHAINKLPFEDVSILSQLPNVFGSGTKKCWPIFSMLENWATKRRVWIKL